MQDAGFWCAGAILGFADAILGCKVPFWGAGSHFGVQRSILGCPVLLFGAQAAILCLTDFIQGEGRHFGSLRAASRGCRPPF